MAKAVIEDSGAVMPVCAWVDGEYGISGVYLGVEAEIGRNGVNKVVESKLTDLEVTALKKLQLKRFVQTSRHSNTLRRSMAYGQD